MHSLKRQKLIEEYVRNYVKSLMLEDSPLSSGDSPQGVRFAGTGAAKLANIFFGPFLDAFKIGLGGVKEIAARTKTLLHVVLGTVVSTLAPVLGARYGKIFEEEKKQIEKIREGYKDAEKRVNDSLRGGDAALFAFMASPGLFLGYEGGKFGKKATLETLSIISGGYFDKLVEESKGKLKGFDKFMLDGFRWGVKSESFHRYESSLAQHYLFLTEKKKSKFKLRPAKKDDSKNSSEEDSEKDANVVYEKELRKIIDLTLQSSAVEKMRKDAKQVYRKSLNDVVKLSREAAEIKNIADLRKFLKESDQMDKKLPDGTTLEDGLKELESMNEKDRRLAEQKLLSGISEIAKEFCSQKLEEKIKSVIVDGIPENSQYVKDIKEAIALIKK